MSNLDLFFDGGNRSLSVRDFTVEEGLSTLFRATIVARSPDEGLDLESFLGKPSMFRISSGLLFAFNGVRQWSGICSAMELVRVEPSGLSTYELTIVPALWLLTQRRNNRLFQHINIPTMIDRLLAEWSIEPIWEIDRSAYPRLELRIQYNETDYDFFCRLLEEAGITFYFQDDVQRGSMLVLSDHPHTNEARAAGLPIAFVDSAGQSQSLQLDYLTEVRLGHEVRPGRFTVRDFDFRRPTFPLFGNDVAGSVPEVGYEHYHYQPSATLMELESPVSAAALSGPMAAAARTRMAMIDQLRMPVADDKGTARFEQSFGAERARRSLESLRAGKRRVFYKTNVMDLAPGVVFSMALHPRLDLAPDKKLLVTRFSIQGAPGEEWVMQGVAQFAEHPHRPPMSTRKPVIHGLQSAIVVGPPGEEIYTDELGRVRVQFHWDREGAHDDNSSIWMRVSQGWAGSGYGIFTVPRVGHELLVAFLDGDPDSPIITGRAFNALNQVPYKLPENKTVSTWKSCSSPGSDGFNELRFEDAARREHVYLQAQKDLDVLVKNNEMHAVGNDRTRVVQHDETITVGNDRTKVVHFNEIESTGMNRTVTVGVNRNATIGVDDSTLVGSKFSVTMARGLTAKLARELGQLMNGPLGPVLSAPIASVLGMIPQTPLGGAVDLLSKLTRGPLAALSALAPETFRSVLQVMEGFVDEPGPPPTSIEMVDRKITFTTGEASIVLDGPNITIHAEGNIMFHAQKSIGVLGDDEVAVAGQRKVLVHSKFDDVIIQGGKNVHLNPFAVTPEELQAAEETDYPPMDRLAPSCGVCGGVLEVDKDGNKTCRTMREQDEQCPLCRGILVEGELGKSCPRAAIAE
jgi:type VI secretion system secreted protein VgrG